MKKTAMLLSALMLVSSAKISFAESVNVGRPEINIENIEMPEVSEALDMEILSAGQGYSFFSLDNVNPTVTSAQQAVLTGSVEGGTIASDGKSVEFENGESVSVYTLSIDPGDYTIDGFCVSCSDGDESLIKDFNIPAITDGEVTVNIIVNRPEVSIGIGTLKSNGKDSFNGKGVPYSYEIVEGNASDWRLSDDGHTIEEYVGEAVDTLVIPNMIGGKTIFSVQNVTLIEEGKIGTLFGECTITDNGFSISQKANSIEISEGIQLLGTFLFAGCEFLEGEIDIPQTVRLIGPYAYYCCSGLTGDVDLSGCTALYPYTFCGCSSLDGELILPQGITSVPQGIFIECPFSGTLEIPEGVTEIAPYAFAMNSSRTSGFTAIELPSTLKTIGAVAFQYRSTFNNSLELSEGLTHIGDFAFDHCNKLTNTSLVIPSTVETIGGDLAVVKGEGETNTGYGGHVFYDAFRSSTAFEITNGENFKAVDGVLMLADGKRLVAYPSGKTDTSYTIPEGVTQIDEMAFGYSKAAEIVLPDSFVFSTEVPENIINQTGNNFAVAMYVYNSCKNVCVNDTNPNYKSVDGIVYSKDGTELWYVPVKRSSVEIEDGCTTIKSGAFYCRSGSVSWESVTIPSSVTDIEQNALDMLNNSGVTITVSSENSVYEVNSSGKVVKK